MVKFDQIELNFTELCNRKCSFCPRSYDYPNKNEHMLPEVVDAICEQTIPYTNIFTIAGRGEPLLCKYFFDNIEILKKNNKRFTITTNGDYLDGKIDQIHNIMNLNEKYDKTEWTSYKLIVNVYDENKYEEIFQKYKRYKAIHVTKSREEKNLDSLIEKGSITNRGGYLPWVQKKRYDSVRQRPCMLLWYKCFINWNGDLNLCCNDWEYIKSFGNILETSFGELWENGPINEYRMNLLKWGGRQNFNECINCDSDQNFKEGTNFYKQYLKNNNLDYL